MHKCNPGSIPESRSTTVLPALLQLTSAQRNAPHKRIGGRVRKVFNCQLCVLARGILRQDIVHFGRRVHELPYHILLLKQAASSQDAQGVVDMFRGLSATALRKQWLRFIIQGGRDSLIEHLTFVIRCGVAARLVNMTDEFGATALIQAAVRSSPEAVKMLLEIPGIDVNIRDLSGNTALSWTIHLCEEGSEVILPLLLAHPGTDLLKCAPLFQEIPANSGVVAVAEQSRQVRRVASEKSLVVLRRPASASSSVSKITVLKRPRAILGRDFARSMQPDEKAYFGVGREQAVGNLASESTLLPFKVHRDVVHIYLSERKKQWIRDVIPGNPVILSCFIQKGIAQDAINTQDRFGRTALMCAVLQGDCATIGKLLEIRTIDLNVASNFDETVLSLAVQKNNLALVRTLLAHPDIDPNGGTPLLVAAYHNLTDMTDFLLTDQRIDVNIINRHGHTALVLATFLRHHRIVQRLLLVPNIALPEKSGHFLSGASFVAKH